MPEYFYYFQVNMKQTFYETKFVNSFQKQVIFLLFPVKLITE